MLRNELRESNENGCLQCHLAVILHSIPLNVIEMSFLTRDLIDSQEEVIPQRNKLYPVECKCDDVGDSDANDDELDEFHAAPYPFEVSERCRYENERGEKLEHASVARAVSRHQLQTHLRDGRLDKYGGQECPRIEKTRARDESQPRRRESTRRKSTCIRVQEGEEDGEEREITRHRRGCAQRLPPGVEENGHAGVACV